MLISLTYLLTWFLRIKHDDDNDDKRPWSALLVVLKHALCGLAWMCSYTEWRAVLLRLWWSVAVQWTGNAGHKVVHSRAKDIFVGVSDDAQLRSDDTDSLGLHRRSVPAGTQWDCKSVSLNNNVKWLQSVSLFTKNWGKDENPPSWRNADFWGLVVSLFRSRIILHLKSSRTRHSDTQEVSTSDNNGTLHPN